MNDRSTMRRRLRLPLALGCVVALMAGAGLAGAAVVAGPTSAPTAYVPVAPTRVLDTRDGTGTGGVIGKVSSELTLTFASPVPIPADAEAVVLNLTATDSTAASFLSVQPVGYPEQVVSNLNFPAGVTVANMVTVPLGTGNAIRITNAFGEVNVVADLAGYYVVMPPGTNGTNGTNGLPGADGADGKDATNGLASYGYVYNTGAQVVPIEAPIAFDQNGILRGGVAHLLGAAGIVVPNAGDYLVNYSVSSVEPGQFTLFINGAPASGTTYGSGAGTQQNNGQAILTLAVGDVLTVVNHSSSAATTLQTLAGGTQVNVNASLTVQQLSAATIVTG